MWIFKQKPFKHSEYQLNWLKFVSNTFTHTHAETLKWINFIVDQNIRFEYFKCYFRFLESYPQSNDKEKHRTSLLAHMYLWQKFSNLYNLIFIQFKVDWWFVCLVITLNLIEIPQNPQQTFSCVYNNKQIDTIDKRYRIPMETLSNLIVLYNISIT